MMASIALIIRNVLMEGPQNMIVIGFLIILTIKDYDVLVNLNKLFVMID